MTARREPLIRSHGDDDAFTAHASTATRWIHIALRTVFRIAITSDPDLHHVVPTNAPRVRDRVVLDLWTTFPIPSRAPRFSGPKRTPAVKGSAPSASAGAPRASPEVVRSGDYRPEDLLTVRRLSGTAQIIRSERVGPCDAFSLLCWG
jgi:hypothetical protein